jgi:RND family efflux transporter MFP subunit
MKGYLLSIGIETITVEGKTDALRKEKILSPVAGSVVLIRGIEGTPVHAGDTLAVIRTKESQAVIDGAKALLQTARTQAERDEAQRSLSLAVASQSAISIRSRLDGIIAARNVNQGELVPESAELLTVTDLASIYFAAYIPLESLSRVRPGESCHIRFPSIPDAEFQATVSSIEPSADQQSQSVKAHLVFARLQPHERSLMKTDMFGTARIITGVHRGALMVPRSALLRDDETNTVSIVIVSPGSVAKTLAVKVGMPADSLMEVASADLREGQLVITEGNYGLPDSTRLRVTVSEKP